MYPDCNSVYLEEEPPVDEIYEKVMNSGIYEKGFKTGYEIGYKIGYETGYEIGYKQGLFLAALDLKKSLSIDKISLITGFSREELENEVLIDDI
ncbi:hypothetical protein [Methanobrevibacter sp.]